MTATMEDDIEGLNTLKINKQYAARFEHNKRREEITKLKEKYGSDYDPAEDESDSESDETEDEEGELVTPEVDVAILRTIAKIRAKDPSVYSNETRFFTDEIFSQKEEKEKSRKPMKIADFHRQMLLDGQEDPKDEKYMTYNDEQASLRKEVKAAFHTNGEADISEDELLVVRNKTKKEIEEEEKDYKTFLQNGVGEEELKLALKDTGDEETILHDVEEKFLQEFIVNRGWVDKDSERVPNYEEITNQHHDDVEDEFEEKADQFESAYNFRFEDPEAAQIITHTRSVENSVRRKDDSRKRKRDAVQDRKTIERQQKMEELKRLKNLKKREILEKLEQIREITGVDVDGFNDIDLEGDFDPDQYDKKMAQVYDDGYYSTKDNTKPVFEDIEINNIIQTNEETGDDDKKKKKKKKKSTEENVDEDINMDADFQDTNEGKKKSDHKKMIHKALEEIYNLDYEDMVGDLPTRFKYTKVQPEAFGLTPAEILLADDSLLNDYIGLKKLAPYRHPDKIKTDKKKFTKHGRVKEFKRKLWSAVENEGMEVDGRGWKRIKPEKKSKVDKGKLKEKVSHEGAGSKRTEKETKK